MKSLKWRQMLALSTVACIVFALPVTASAVNFMDLRAEQLVFSTSFLKESLALTPNQQILWQQVTSKASTLLRVRQSRRERLQAAMNTALKNGLPDLRELAGSVDAEASSSAGEEKQLVELALTMNDALNDHQRGIVNQFLLGEFERVERGERPSKPEREGGAPGGGGKGRQKPGGGSGARPQF